MFFTYLKMSLVCEKNVIFYTCIVNGAQYQLQIWPSRSHVYVDLKPVLGVVMSERLHMVDLL